MWRLAASLARHWLQVPSLPIGWSDHGSRGPVTVIGQRELQDVTSAVYTEFGEKMTVVVVVGGACDGQAGQKRGSAVTLLFVSLPR